MSDNEMGKRMEENEHLALFLDAYQRATGEQCPTMYGSETPDFIGTDEEGQTVGIELTKLRFAPDERHMRSIIEPGPHDPDAWWRLLELMYKKQQTLTKGNWFKCQRKILVIMLVDTTIAA